MAIIGSMMGSLGGAGGAAAAGGASSGAAGGAASSGGWASMFGSMFSQQQGQPSSAESGNEGFGAWLGAKAGAGNNPFVQAGNSILQSAGSFLQQKAMANALNKQQKRAWKANVANVREQYRQVGQQMQAAGQDYANAGLANQMSLAEQRAGVELMAAATGTGGGAITSMLTDLNAQGGRNQAQIIENFERQQQGFVNRLKGIQSSGQMVIRKFEKPKLFNMLMTEGLKAGGVAAKGLSEQRQQL